MSRLHQELTSDFGSVPTLMTRHLEGKGTQTRPLVKDQIQSPLNQLNKQTPTVRSQSVCQEAKNKTRLMLKLDQCISWPQETAISSSVWLTVFDHDTEAVALFLGIKQTRFLGFILALEAAAFYAQKYRPKLPPLQTWLLKSKFCI